MILLCRWDSHYDSHRDLAHIYPSLYDRRRRRRCSTEFLPQGKPDRREVITGTEMVHSMAGETSTTLAVLSSWHVDPKIDTSDYKESKNGDTCTQDKYMYDQIAIQSYKILALHVYVWCLQIPNRIFPVFFQNNFNQSLISENEYKY